MHRDYKDVKYPEYKYGESGMAMSFSELNPVVVLEAVDSGKVDDDMLQTDFKMIRPSGLLKKTVRLFKEPYDKLYEDRPIKFFDIPELAKLISSINDIPSLKTINPYLKGTYVYKDWLSMNSYKEGT